MNRYYCCDTASKNLYLNDGVWTISGYDADDEYTDDFGNVEFLTYFEDDTYTDDNCPFCDKPLKFSEVLHDLVDRLWSYESKYRMDSETFINKFDNKELEKSQDFLCWRSVYSAYKRASDD